jgi:hypothetical protein
LRRGGISFAIASASWSRRSTLDRHPPEKKALADIPDMRAPERRSCAVPAREARRQGRTDLARANVRTRTRHTDPTSLATLPRLKRPAPGAGREGHDDRRIRSHEHARPGGREKVSGEKVSQGKRCQGKDVRNLFAGKRCQETFSCRLSAKIDCEGERCKEPFRPRSQVWCP